MGRVPRNKHAALKGDVVSNILRQHLAKKKQEKSKLSLRSLAKQVGLSHAYLSQVVNGHRNLPPDVFDDLCDLLDIDQATQEVLLVELLKVQGWKRVPRKDLLETKKTTAVANKKWKSVLAEDFDLLENWFYIPILDATRIAGYDGSAEFLAKRLGLNLSVVRRALDKLERAGYLEKDKNGRLRKAHDFLEFHSKDRVKSIRNFQLQMLDKVKNTVKEQQTPEDVSRRLLLSYTHTISREHVPVISRKIAEMLREFSVEAGSQKPEEVYTLGAFFVPLTKEP